MKVLMISGDQSILQKGTAANRRYKLQAAQVQELSVLFRKPGESKLSAARRMMREGREGEWDIVTAQDPFLLGLIACRIVKFSGTKLQLQVHTDLDAQSVWKKWLASYCLRRANSVRVVSERVRRQVEALAPGASITVLPVFIDNEAIRAAAPADLHKAFPQFQKIILVASRLEPEKDVALAIRTFDQVHKTMPRAGLIIAGEGSQLVPLQELVRDLALQQSVLFLGYRSDIFSCYKGANLVLNTSKYEGFGATVVEALAAGCAVLSTNVGVAREAGAAVALPKELPAKATELLNSNAKGALQMLLPPALEWSRAWRDSL